jgi:hypothetical protein
MSDAQPYKPAIISGVVATIIAAFVISLFPGWSAVLGFIGRIAGVFTCRVPLWSVALAVIFLLMIFQLWKASESLEEGPDFYAYNTDRFFNVVWRWEYTSSGQPTNILAFCPKCEMQLVYHDSGGRFRGGLNRTILFCEGCDENAVDIDATAIVYVLERVARLIQRNIRTGAYRSLVTKRVDGGDVGARRASND